MSRTLPGGVFLIRWQIFFRVVSERNMDFCGIHVLLRTGVREGAMRAHNRCLDQNLLVRCKYAKKFMRQVSGSFWSRLCISSIGEF